VVTWWRHEVVTDDTEIVDADVRELWAARNLAIAQTPDAVVCSRSLT